MQEGSLNVFFLGVLFVEFGFKSMKYRADGGPIQLNLRKNLEFPETKKHYNCLNLERFISKQKRV